MPETNLCLLHRCKQCIGLCITGLILEMAYLADSLQRVTDVQSHRRLRSSSSSSLIVPVTRRATLGGRAFPFVAARAWNALPDFVMSAPTFASFHASKPFDEDVGLSGFPDFLTLATRITL